LAAESCAGIGGFFEGEMGGGATGGTGAEMGLMAGRVDAGTGARRRDAPMLPVFLAAKARIAGRSSG